jgi:hypothetical protein
MSTDFGSVSSAGREYVKNAAIVDFVPGYLFIFRTAKELDKSM